MQQVVDVAPTHVIESLTNDDEAPTYDDEYANIAALATDLDGVVADLEVGDYVSFSQQNMITWLPGVISEISDDYCTVQAMKKSTGDSFVWPSNGEVDESVYKVGIKDLLCILEEPVFQQSYWSFCVGMRVMK